MQLPMLGLEASLWPESLGLYWVGRKRWCISHLGVALCDSVSSFGRVLDLQRRPRKLTQAEHFLGKYLLPKGDFQKADLGPYSLVHTWVPACAWRVHFLGVLGAIKGKIITCAATPLAATGLLCSLPWYPPSQPTWPSVSSVQNPAFESISPRDNCFNLIKWKRNLKWLNVYLLTVRNVL